MNDKIRQDLKTAMLAKDETAVMTLRMLLSEIKYAEVAGAEYQTKLEEERAEAREKERALNLRLETAQNEAAKRQAENAASAVAAARTSARLRDALDALARGLPADTAEALRGHASKLAEALGACDDEQREMARLADGYWNAAKTLSDGWPH
jgi:chromosome segregation ATPase